MKVNVNYLRTRVHGILQAHLHAAIDAQQKMDKANVTKANEDIVKKVSAMLLKGKVIGVNYQDYRGEFWIGIAPSSDIAKTIKTHFAALEKTGGKKAIEELRRKASQKEIEVVDAIMFEKHPDIAKILASLEKWDITK